LALDGQKNWTDTVLGLDVDVGLQVLVEYLENVQLVLYYGQMDGCKAPLVLEFAVY